MKVFISALTGTPIDDIADDHVEVLALSGKTTDAMIRYLTVTTDALFIDSFYEKLQWGGSP